jgi:Na+-translocating ferredoxin:NAD+ oxidoreductase RnfD subunit
VPLSILFSVSIVLCLVRLCAHSLAASALVHAAYNGTIFVAIFIATDGFRHLDKISQ